MKNSILSAETNLSIFSPRSSFTTERTRDPFGPTHAPTGSMFGSFDATAIFEMHPDLFDRQETLVGAVAELFRFPLVRYTRADIEQKFALNCRHGGWDEQRELPP